MIRIITIFKEPLIVLGGIFAYLLLTFAAHQQVAAVVILLAVIMYGSFELFKETVESLIRGKFALDYIAITAILLGVFTGNYLVASIIVLMLSGGTTLEKYGMEQAKGSLTALADRIPNSVYLAEKNAIGVKKNIDEVKVGEVIYVRKGEVIPLDGVLLSPAGLTDESSLTGEPYEIEKQTGDIVRSGTVNVGDAMVIRVTHENRDSTYAKIVEMVKQAEAEKSPLIRLADRYSVVFTIITFILASLGFILSHGSWDRVLAVLVIATPCPLILATPIALMGGVNAAARKRIIMKRLATLEVLSRVNTVIFDKTGTITLGKPTVHEIEVQDKNYTIRSVLSIAAGIERSSLHPFAKAVVEEAQHRGIKPAVVTAIEEELGSGISGVVRKKRFTIRRAKSVEGMAIDFLEGNKHIARFYFEDHIKKESKSTIERLKHLGLDILIFTGDKRKAAERIVEQLDLPIQIFAECKPEDKKDGISRLKKQHKITAMIGDGINDAPALALADVGMVFSNEEHTAASEAADVIFLGGDFGAVMDTMLISRRTINIALQSILFGIGLSCLGMIFAAAGFLPAIAGAFLQELIDVLVIFNALRASR